MKYSGPKERVDAARSRETDEEELNQLAESKFIFIRTTVAENASTSPHTLSRLIPSALESDEDWQMALALLKNENLNKEQLDLVLELVLLSLESVKPRDYYPNEVIHAIVESSQTPETALLRFADSSSVPKHIRGRIAKEGTRKELLSALMLDESTKVAGRASNAMHRQNPDPTK